VGRAITLVRRFWPEAFAVVMGVIGTIDAIQHPLGYDAVEKGPDLLVWLTPIAISAPMLLRRWLPFAGPAGTLVGAIVMSFAASGEAVVDGPMFFLLLASVFLLGGLDTRSANAGLALAFVTVVAVNANSQDAAWGDYVFPIIFFSLVWGFGRVLRLREEKVAEAEARAARIQAEQQDRAVQAVTEERQRIARELHDVIAHSVSVMTVQAGAVRRLLLPEQEKERAALETVEATGRQALTEMRRLVGLLREQGAMPEFAPQPGMKTLDTLLATVRDAGLPVQLEVEGEPRELAPGVDLSAYRVVQEALTNALKYAGPARAWVTVRWHEQELELEVANDGRVGASGNGVGHGLAGMQERVALVGGTIETGRHPVNGFVVRARLPLQTAA
jgi:signal transduction histidine kinase